MQKPSKLAQTPQIRFAGFTDPWERRKLSEICQYRSSSLTAKDISDDGNYDLYDANSIIGKTNKEYMKTDYITIIKDGAGVGRTRLLPKNSMFLGTMGALTSQNSDLNFLYQLITNANLSKEYSGSTIPHIYFKNYGENKYYIPSLQEQQKIGELFANLDNLITLHQRKCESLKSLKKSMLQKMFPKNGASVPEIRFAGFTGDWERRKLGEVYSSIGNAFVGTATPYYVEQGHLYLESNNIKDGQINHNSEIFINDDFYEKQKDKWLHTGDIVMVQSGHVGHAAVIPEELNNSAAHALIMFKNPKIKIDPYFLNYQYQTNKAKKKIEGITTGNTIKHILASDMQEFVVDVPNNAEQVKIGTYFQSLDNLITLQQRKVEKLKEIKAAMLSKAFI